MLSGKICFPHVGTIRSISSLRRRFLSWQFSCAMPHTYRVFNNLMFSQLSQMVCTVFDFYAPSWCWHRSPEIGTSCIHWAQLSRFYQTTETESSLRNIRFWKINRTVILDQGRTMDNVQKHNICTSSYSSSFVIFVKKFVTVLPKCGGDPSCCSRTFHCVARGTSSKCRSNSFSRKLLLNFT
jgi:hypothetical protein